MVMLKEESRKQFPTFDEYLGKNFLHVRSKPRVMEAFWKWSAWAEPDYWRRNYYYIFSYGSEPKIEVGVGSYIDSLCVLNDKKTKVLGVKYAVTPNGGKVIVLHGNLVRETEEALLRVRASKKNPDDDRILTLMEATIMHEMVHWSYMVAGVDEKKKYGGDEEYGTARFEQEAYGSPVAMPDEFRERLCKVRPAAPFLGVATNLACTILEVKPESPAAKAGLIKGDRISKFDGKNLGKELNRDNGGNTAQAEFGALLDQKQPGDSVSLEIHRMEPPGTDKIFTVNVTLGSIN
ncbi:MAG TPA: PDZ domain-containing protein [Candidatus Competibacter sp.]|nr:hypothetical protein [Candidatus Competibacteraceae bacterium]HRC73392.1 PDZ domain-containing protein [Candidatus Competibacter sp.]